MKVSCKLAIIGEFTHPGLNRKARKCSNIGDLSQEQFMQQQDLLRPRSCRCPKPQPKPWRCRTASEPPASRPFAASMQVWPAPDVMEFMGAKDGADAAPKLSRTSASAQDALCKIANLKIGLEDGLGPSRRALACFGTVSNLRQRLRFVLKRRTGHPCLLRPRGLRYRPCGASLTSCHG